MINEKSETTTITSQNESQSELNQDEANAIQEQKKPKDIVLNNKIILDAVKMYNKLSSQYGKEQKEEEESKMLLEATIFMLNGKRISKIANLEIYENLQELYLSNNYITEICGLEHLISLQVLNLKGNYIKEIKNIKHLNKLEILDISYNEIDKFAIEEIPCENLYYVYLFDNPFFETTSILLYRSKLIQKCPLIIRIDKLDISDREKLILIDESNLKSKFSLKCLNFITKHYDNMKNKNVSKLKELDDTIKKDIDNIMSNKTGTKKEKQEKEDYTNKSMIDNKEEEVDQAKIKEKINDLQQQSDEFMKSSMFSLQEKSAAFSKRSQENKKKFLESDTVKELKKQITILSEKFKQTNFVDPKVKEAFHQKILNAMNFEKRILNAESYVKNAIQKLTADNTSFEERVKEINPKINDNDRAEIRETTGHQKEILHNEDTIISTSKELLENDSDLPKLEPKTETNPVLITDTQKVVPKGEEKKSDNPLLSDSDIDDEEEKTDKI